MTIVVVCIIYLAFGFIKDAIEQNDPYYGTSRDHFRNNPDFVGSRRRAHEIYEKHRWDSK